MSGISPGPRAAPSWVMKRGNNSGGPGSAGWTPGFSEEFGGGWVEGGELALAEDGGLDVRRRDAELAIAATGGFLEQRGTHAGDGIPVGVEGVEIALGDAAAQVGGEILNVLGLGAVDVRGRLRLQAFFGSAISETGTMRA
jgi:hypothetical protein